MLSRLEYSTFVRSRIKWFPTAQENLLHAAVGLIGEVIELEAASSPVNFREEAGDCEFYMEHAYLAIERIQFADVEGRFVEKPGTAAALLPIVRLRQSAGLLLDLAKKAWVYNKPMESLPIQEALGFCVTAANGLLREANLDPAMVRQENYEKLMRRYPKGYTDTAAQARADKIGGEE